MTRHKPAVGTAGWSIPALHAHAFPQSGSHLERYARQLPVVEINSTFYRPHKPTTYERWSASVPPSFRFAAKIPKAITHERRLVDVEEPLRRFLSEVEVLGNRLGPLLVQLPPSLRYDAAVTDRFFSRLRTLFAGNVVCEPRDATWFTDAVDAKLSEFRIARVAADPAVVPRAAEPGGWRALTYRRLHGSPEMYRSGYPAAFLDKLALQILNEYRDRHECWCIFDNTALGEATKNALDLLGGLQRAFSL